MRNTVLCKQKMQRNLVGFGRLGEGDRILVPASSTHHIHTLFLLGSQGPPRSTPRAPPPFVFHILTVWVSKDNKQLLSLLMLLFLLLSGGPAHSEPITSL